MPYFQHAAWYIRLTCWEYWPIWIFYIPVWLQHFWLAIKQRNLFFFLATNPAIEGFILSDSKYRTLKLVPAAYRPESILISPGSAPADVLRSMSERGIAFPVMLKPDVGYRGIKVRKVVSAEQLRQEVCALNVPTLLQEYCEGPMEVGIFYYRYPDENEGHLLSVTLKEFLKVTGDGHHTLRELIRASPRASLHVSKIRERFGGAYHKIVPKGQVLLLESIGSHNRGTRFIDGNHLIDEELRRVFDGIGQQMAGFYFGRFDIRAKSWQALKNGEFKIIEVNGVGGEPTHIYDSSNSIRRAWLDLCKSWQVAARIAGINFSMGVKRPGFAKARSLWNSYRKYRATLSA